MKNEFKHPRRLDISAVGCVTSIGIGREVLSRMRRLASTGEVRELPT